MMVPKSPELGVAMAFFRQNKAEKTTLVTPFLYFFHYMMQFPTISWHRLKVNVMYVYRKM